MNGDLPWSSILATAASKQLLHACYMLLHVACCCKLSCRTPGLDTSEFAQQGRGGFRYSSA